MVATQTLDLQKLWAESRPVQTAKLVRYPSLQSRGKACCGANRLFTEYAPAAEMALLGRLPVGQSVPFCSQESRKSGDTSPVHKASTMGILWHFPVVKLPTCGLPPSERLARRAEVSAARG